MSQYPPGDAPVGKLQISLLGSPRIEWDGQPLSIPRRQVRALLYRLAAEPRPLNRSYLSYLFWADCPENAARQNLSRLLVYLTRALPLAKLIQADETQILLAQSLLQVDICAYDRHWEAWKSNRNDDELQAAAALYRSAFLDGFYLPGSPEYNAWIQEGVEYWEQLYLKTLALLVESSTSCGDLPLAIEYANRYLARDDLAEEVHRRLIELHAASGDRRAALHQYEVCATVLERELGVRPAPETVAAYHSALDRKLPVTDLPTPPPVWTILPSLQAPLIGRQDILAKLDQALAQARTGRGQVVFVYGEPGIGKSRLVQEFTSRSHPRMRLLIGSATQECCKIPYQPLVEAFRPVIGNPAITHTVPTTWITEIGRLFPEIVGRTHLAQSTPPLNDYAARSRLFEALYHILLGITDGGFTLILCLDDLHWADPTTLDWLAYAGHRIANQRILIIGTYRQDEAEGLADLRGSLSRQANFRELHLGGLTCADVNQLCEILDISLLVDDLQTDRLCQATGGNPFFLLEILREMQESVAHGDRVEHKNLPLPATVQAAVGGRLERLHPQVRQVLEAASVLGLAFSFELVGQTSGRGEMEILDGLDELVARQFLVESGTGYHFCHAIIREAVYANLGYWRKQKLHERAGLALEKMNSEEWPTIAWHFAQSGECGKAARYALRAGQAARAVFAHVEARADFEQALSLLALEAGKLSESQAVEANQRLRIQALYERGWALRLLGEMNAYTHDLETVARLAQDIGDPQALAHLRWREAYNHRWFCRYAASQAAALQGLRLSQECADPHLQAQCQRELGMAARETGETALAQAALERALELFQTQATDAVYVIHTLGNLSTLHCRQGNTGQALELARQALDACEHCGLPYERRLPLGDMGAALAAAGGFEDAQAHLWESLAIARQIADRTQEIFCLGHLGWVRLYQQDAMEALRFLQEALALAEQVGSLTEQSWLHAGLAEAHARLGEQDQALAHAGLAQQIAQAHSRLPDQRVAERLIAKLRA